MRDLVLPQIMLEHEVLPTQEFRHLRRSGLSHRSEVRPIVKRLRGFERRRSVRWARCDRGREGVELTILSHGLACKTEVMSENFESVDT